MASIREQTQNSAACSAPLAHPSRRCLSCLCVLARVARSWWNCLLFCCLPWQKKFADSEASNVGTVRSHFFPSVVFHSIKPANQQKDLTLETSKRERGGEGREGNAAQCVRRVKWVHDRKRAWSWSLFPDCLQIASSLMSAAKLNLHTHTHTQIPTEAIQWERGFSPESIVQISWPYNSQRDQTKPDLCSERWLSLQSWLHKQFHKTH